MRKKVILSRLYLVSGICYLLSALSGCESLLNQDYRVVAPHLEQHTQEGDQAVVMEASNLADLKRRLIQLVRQRSETGRILLNNYAGDYRFDMSIAYSEIIREDAVCAYTVASIYPEYMPLGTEVNVKIGYLAGRDKEIAEIPTLDGLTNELALALQTYETGLVLELRYFDRRRDADISTLLRDAYYQRPELAVGMPAMTYALYPPDGSVGCVIEMKLTYGPDTETVEESLERRKQRVVEADKALRALWDGCPEDLDPPHMALWLYDSLCAEVGYDAELAGMLRDGEPTDDGDNLYTALVKGPYQEKGRAVSAGFALAYKLLCEKAGIECELVIGTRNNVQHFWNVIKLDGDWYHVDAATDTKEGRTHGWFLKDDEEMQAEARWTQNSTPKCESDKISYETLTQAPDGENGEPAAIEASAGPGGEDGVHEMAGEVSPGPDGEE